MESYKTIEGIIIIGNNEPVTGVLTIKLTHESGCMDILFNEKKLIHFVPKKLSWGKTGKIKKEQGR
jgi:hypothetical protein